MSSIEWRDLPWRLLISVNGETSNNRRLPVHAGFSCITDIIKTDGHLAEDVSSQKPWLRNSERVYKGVVHTMFINAALTPSVFLR